MRVSSVMWRSSSSGTLKSTRTSARFPFSCAADRSRTVSLGIRLQLAADVLQQVHAARCVPPLVVVPAAHLHEESVHHVRALAVQDARMRVADVVARHELDVRVLEDALELTLGGLLEGRVDLLDRDRLVDDDG